jgi:hypothetical protein
VLDLVSKIAEENAEKNGGSIFSYVLNAAIFHPSTVYLKQHKFVTSFLGSALGISYAQTRNLLTPITIHAFWNSGVILLLTVLQVYCITLCMCCQSLLGFRIITVRESTHIHAIIKSKSLDEDRTTDILSMVT